MMDEKLLMEIYKEIGEMKGTQEAILKKINLMCKKCDEREKRINTLEETISNHKMYFKMISGALLALFASVMAKIVEIFYSWKHG